MFCCIRSKYKIAFVFNIKRERERERERGTTNLAIRLSTTTILNLYDAYTFSKQFHSFLYQASYQIQ
jgi:hypothetical protein